MDKLRNDEIAAEFVKWQHGDLESGNIIYNLVATFTNSWIKRTNRDISYDNRMELINDTTLKVYKHWDHKKAALSTYVSRICATGVVDISRRAHRKKQTLVSDAISIDRNGYCEYSFTDSIFEVVATDDIIYDIMEKDCYQDIVNKIDICIREINKEQGPDITDPANYIRKTLNREDAPSTSKNSSLRSKYHRLCKRISKTYTEKFGNPYDEQ